MDARETKLKTLPNEIGKIATLLKIELQGSPLDEDIMEAFDAGTKALLKRLKFKGERTLLMKQLQNKLSNA